MVQDYWPQIASGSGLVKYENATGAWIAIYCKISTTYGTVVLHNLDQRPPFFATISSDGWKWSNYVLDSDTPIKQVVNSSGYLSSGRFGFYEDPGTHIRYLVVFDNNGMWGKIQVS